MYKWTDGYKVVNMDMTAIISEFKYEIGKEHEFAGEPVVCNSGFHFYKNIYEVMPNFLLYGFRYRYFKVRAFYDPNKHAQTLYGEGTKYTSKKIILLEEIPYEKIVNGFFNIKSDFMEEI